MVITGETSRLRSKSPRPRFSDCPASGAVSFFQPLIPLYWTNDGVHGSAPTTQPGLVSYAQPSPSIAGRVQDEFHSFPPCGCHFSGGLLFRRNKREEREKRCPGPPSRGLQLAPVSRAGRLQLARF